MMSIKQLCYVMVMVAGLSVAVAAMTYRDPGPSGPEGRTALSSAAATQATAVTGRPVAVRPQPAQFRLIEVPEPASMFLLGSGLVCLAGIVRRSLARRD